MTTNIAFPVYAILASALLTPAAMAQGAAAPAAPTAAAAPAEETRWALVGDTRQFMIFLGQDSVQGPPATRQAVSLWVLKEANAEGVIAQQTHYTFDCDREEFQETGHTFFLEGAVNAGHRPVEAPENVKFKDNDVGEQVGLMVCDDSIPERVFSSLQATLDYTEAN
jgi:hypothetical protein